MIFVEEIGALLALKKYDSEGLMKVWKISEAKARELSFSSYIFPIRIAF